MNKKANITPVENPPSFSAWLSGHNLYPKTYWANREGTLEVASIGASSAFRSLEALEQHLQNYNPEIPIIGGLRFDSARPLGEEWQDFGDCFFITPQTALIRTEDSVFEVDVNDCVQPKCVQLECSKLGRSELTPPQSRIANPSSSQGDLETRALWQQYHSKALDGLRQKLFEKVVIARRKPMLTPNMFPFEHIGSVKEEKYQFLFAPNHATFFFSQSPERLLRYRAGDFLCDCIGGTVWSDSQHPGPPTVPSSVKQEHQVILEDILSQVGDITVGKPSVTSEQLLSLGSIFHIKSEISGQLKANMSALSLLNRLHPTAAVGGFPRHTAAEFIRTHEDFDRGWYAAPIGCIYGGIIEFAVGIRSVLIDGPSGYAYAGCGVVPGSTAEREWEETVRKFESFSL